MIHIKKRVVETWYIEKIKFVWKKLQKDINTKLIRNKTQEMGNVDED